MNSNRAGIPGSRMRLKTRILRTIFLFLISSPLFVFSQKRSEKVSLEEVQILYNSLPRESEKVQWREVVKLDSSYTMKVLKTNVDRIFSQLITDTRNRESKLDAKQGTFSAVGSFTIEGGPQNAIVSRVYESRDIDFNIEISYRDGEYTFTIYDILTTKTRVHQMSNNQEYMNVHQITLDEAFDLCTRSNTKKMERILFQKTVNRMNNMVELIKIYMAKQ